jgi:hypothetical protein
MNIRKLSSIPGRIRLYIEGLKGNYYIAIHIENMLTNFSHIQSININTKTGNILLIYNSYYINEDMIFRIISSSSIKVNNLAKLTYCRNKASNCSKELLQNTKSLSRGLLALSLSVASILFFTSSPTHAICSLILGFPGVIYLTSYFSLKYILHKAYLNNVYIKDIHSIRYIKNMKGISLHPSIVFNNNFDKFKSINYFRLESLIYTNKIDNLINIEVRKLIKNLRTIGLNNITIISNYRNNNLILYANKSLGLYDHKENQQHEITVINYKDLSEIDKIDRKIILSISPSKKFYEDNITIACSKLCQISWLIEVCMNSEEHLVRAHSIAVSINVFGIFLALIKFISLNQTILLYLMNTLGNLFYIKYNIIHTIKNNKELPLWKPKEL